MNLRLTLTIGSLCALLLLSGCGRDFGPMGSIAGTLKINGEVPPEGTKLIFMEPAVGHAGYGLTDTTGAFRIEWRKDGQAYDGLPVGSYQVMLVPADMVDVDEISADEMLDGGAPRKMKSSIPAKFLRASTSGLQYQISEGENQIDVAIET